jgi:hypothetical protein
MQNMKKIEEISLTFYEKLLGDLWQGKKDQSLSFMKSFVENFNFPTIECIETGASQNLKDGCFGILLAKMCFETGGIFSSVDLSSSISSKSSDLYNEIFPDFPVNHYVGDSIEFLKKYEGSANLIHLDSWDLDLKNPIPSMLHGWLEFDAIRDKMPSGSICLVDDNYLKGSWVSWNWIDPNLNVLSTEPKAIDITYEIVGKGSLIYHWAQKEDTDWDLIGDHYHPGKNIKLILKKR